MQVEQSGYGNVNKGMIGLKTFIWILFFHLKWKLKKGQQSIQ